MIDVFAAVIGVEAEDGKREGVEHLRDDRQQVGFGDGLYAGHHFPLGDAVHGVDVVQALGTIQVALMHGIDADEAGSAIGCRCPAHADGDGVCGPGLGQQHARGAVTGAAPQVVQMAHREARQAAVVGVAIARELAAQYAGGGGARERVHGAIHIGQQSDIGRRVFACEGVCRGAVALDQRRPVAPPSYQPRDLGAAVATQALQVDQHRAAIRAPQLAVAKAIEHGTDPHIAPGVIVRAVELQRGRTGKYLTYLHQRTHLRLVHVDHHVGNDRPCASAAYPVRLISRWNHGGRFRLIPRWKRL